MHRTLGPATILVLSTLLASPVARAGDWPQFRGPGGAGSSGDTGLPVRWSKTENLRWTADLPGRGVSAPVIVGDKVYVTACSGFQQARLHVLCFDLASGKQLWHRQFWATGNTLCHQKTCTAAPTPVTDGERVYALFATADLVCLDATGNLVWYRSLTGDYPTVGNNVGMAASPILWQDLLIVPMDNAGESFAAGLDKYNGKNRWKVERSRDICWTTPLAIRNGDRAEVLFQSSKDLTAYDPATGRKLWSHEAKFGTAPSPAAGKGLVLAPGGGQVTALRPEAEQPPKVLWQSNKLKTSYASPLYYQDRVYTVSFPVGVVTCVDATNGELVWQTERLKGQHSASPIAGDGKIYLVNEEGTTTVLQTGPKPQILATNELGETMLATPAIAAGAIFLRSDQHLFCIGAKGRR